MSSSSLIAFVVVAVLAIGGAVAYVVRDYDYLPRPASTDARRCRATTPRRGHRRARGSCSAHRASTTTTASWPWSPLDDPAGPRAFTDVACDRVDATATGPRACAPSAASSPSTPGTTSGPTHRRERARDLRPGIPSRTRLSPDGTLVASTVFVAGHSYMQVGFSTATEIRDGRRHRPRQPRAVRRSCSTASTVAPLDRNIWGVTFATTTTPSTPRSAPAGRPTWSSGDLAARTLTAVADDAECPALSPDGTTVGFKRGRPSATGRPGGRRRCSTSRPASGPSSPARARTASTTRCEWLDDDTLLYGLPRDRRARRHRRLGSSTPRADASARDVHRAGLVARRHALTRYSPVAA